MASVGPHSLCRFSQRITPWLSLASSVANNPWCFLAHRCTTPAYASVIPWPSPVCPNFLRVKNTSHWMRACRKPIWPHLNLITSAKTLLGHIRRLLGFRTPAYLLGVSTHQLLMHSLPDRTILRVISALQSRQEGEAPFNPGARRTPVPREMCA